jgi:tRNA (guanine-N7-)-methyltransferase
VGRIENPELIPVPGRMAPNEVLAEARAELIRKSAGFSRIECDFGASKGKFLTESAVLNPAVFFAGIEGLSDRVNRANRKIERQGIANASLWRGWGKESLDTLIPDGFLDTLHVSFPDPWPKRRHWFRRLVKVPFLEVAARKLKPGGVLRLMTDHLGYFASMKEEVATHSGWVEVDWQDGFQRPVTEFETIFLAKGDPIGRVAVKRGEGLKRLKKLES